MIGKWDLFRIAFSSKLPTGWIKIDREDLGLDIALHEMQEVIRDHKSSPKQSRLLGIVQTAEQAEQASRIRSQIIGASWPRQKIS